MRDNKWVRLLAYVTGLVNQRLLRQHEYLIVENRIPRSHLPSRLRLSDPERSTLAEIRTRGHSKELLLVASVALPDSLDQELLGRRSAKWHMGPEMPNEKKCPFTSAPA